MLIEEIHIRNFLSHRDTRIGFSTGINIIIGKNGAGKSSIVDAMRMALFGNNDIDRRMISYNETESSVTVRFRHNMHTYEITRVIDNRRGRENTKRAFIIKDGTKIGEGATEVTAAVERELEIGKLAFINSVYVKQGDIDGLITSRPADRKDILSEIIGLKDYDKALSHIDPIIKNLESETRDYEQKRDQFKEISQAIQILEDEIAKNSVQEKDIEEKLVELRNYRDKLFGKIKSIEDKKQIRLQKNEDISKITNDIYNLERDIKALEKQKIAYEAKMMELEKLKNDIKYSKRREIRDLLVKIDQINRIGKELDDLKKNRDNYFKSLQRMKDLEGNYSRYNQLKKNLEELEQGIVIIQKNWEEFRKYFSLYEDNRNRRTDAIRKLEKIKEALSDRIDLKIVTRDYVELARKEKRDTKEEMQRKISEEEGTIKSYSERMREIREKMEKLESAPICPLCGQNIEGHKHEEIFNGFNSEIEDKKREIEGIQNHIDALKRKIKKIQDELSVLESREINDYLNLVEKIGQHDASEQDYMLKMRQNEEGKNKYEKDQKIIQDVKKEIEALADDYREYSSLEANTKLFEEMKIDERIKEKEKDIENIKSLIDKYPDLMEMIEKGLNQHDIDKIEMDVEKLSRDVQDSGAIIDIERKMENISILKKQIQDIKKEIETLDEYINEEDKLRKEFQEVDNSLKITQKEKERLLSDISSKRTEREQKSKEKDEIGKYIEETEISRKILSFLSLLRKGISRDGIPKALRGIAVESISAQARNIISRFNLAIEDVKLSDDLDVEIMQDGSVKDLSQLSGGERTALAIGIRLAIAKYLGGDMSTIIMDEPTVYLDEERRNDLRDIIKYSIKELSDENIFPQIIIITHHEELETAADIVYEVKKESGVSSVVAL